MASLDPQLAKYREEQRKRFGEAQVVALAGSAAALTPELAAASASALEKQLRAALAGGGRGGGATAEASALAALEIPEIQLGLLQLALLRSLAASPPQELATSVQPLLRSRASLEALLLSGGSSDLAAAALLSCQLLEEASSDFSSLPPWRLNLAAALALSSAEAARTPHGWGGESMRHEPIDVVQRFRNFSHSAQSQFFESFTKLNAWHMRYVVGSWHADACLAWARRHVKDQYRSPAEIGRAARMVCYREYNDSGVSVQRGLEFYDGKISTMAVIEEYGGVCGAVSKFGASACQAFGVPALPIAQPGHCALYWRGHECEWVLENEISSIAESRVHDGIQRTWRELGNLSDEVGSIAVMERCQTLYPEYVRSELCRLAAPLLSDSPGADVALLAEAVAACPHNLHAWADLCGAPAWHLRRVPAEAIRGVRRRVAATERALGALGPQNLALLRPVRASADPERAQNVVDGTCSEWFPVSEAPQWLVVDLGRFCHVRAVRVQWWGDYGTKTKLEVSSSVIDCSDGGPGSDAMVGAAVPRGRRERPADFNGWTELAGWAEPTRFVRLDLGNPDPDCFGLGKRYGIRQVQVMGHAPSNLEEVDSLGHLFELWAEVSFPGSSTADVQARRLLKEYVFPKLPASASAREEAGREEPRGFFSAFFPCLGR